MIDTIRNWFAARLGKRVRLTRRAALIRDDVEVFDVDDTTFRAHGEHCNVSTKRWIMCYGQPSEGALVIDDKLHCHVISGDGHHFFDVYEDA